MTRTSYTEFRGTCEVNNYKFEINSPDANRYTQRYKIKEKNLNLIAIAKTKRSD